MFNYANEHQAVVDLIDSKHQHHPPIKNNNNKRTNPQADNARQHVAEMNGTECSSNSNSIICNV